MAAPDEATDTRGKRQERFQKKYLSCQMEYGNIEQYNDSTRCKPELVLDLGVLSIPRVAKQPDQQLGDDQSATARKTKGQYCSLVQLQREENYADQSKAKSLVIKIYGYENEAFKELMMARMMEGESSSHESELIMVRQNEIKNSKRGGSDFFQDNADIELKLQLTLRFPEYRDMIDCYQHLETVIETG
jgi:hypothetical protein